MIYVHVPFCHAKCAYCDFYSTPRRQDMERYIGCMGAELASRLPQWDARPVETVYIGGGTPSSLPLTLLDSLIGELGQWTGGLKEFTIEANPEDVTPQWGAHVARNTPIDRVSMGVQSLNDGELSLIGRRHSARQAIDAYHTLRRAGIGNISLDLIYGLPGQTLESWSDSLRRTLDLRPDHLSAYMLTYEPGTRLWAMRSAGKVAEADDETIAAMYAHLCEATRAAGYEHYEISNFALPGRRAAHNSAYWTGHDYLGLGPGAHSCVGGQRSHNPSDLAAYLRAGGTGVAVADEETDDECFNDFIITRLRTADGIDLATAPRRAYIEKTAAPHVGSGRMVAKRGRLRISEPAWLVADTVMEDFIVA